MASAGDDAGDGAGFEVSRRAAGDAAGHHQRQPDQHQPLVAVALAEIAAGQRDDDAGGVEQADQGAELGIADAEIVEDHRPDRADRLELVGPRAARDEQHREDEPAPAGRISHRRRYAPRGRRAGGRARPRRRRDGRDGFRG